MNQLPLSIQKGVAALLEKKHTAKVSLVQFQPLAGGCINQGGKLKTSIGDFFVKWNDANKFPEMFEAEAKGLTLLRTAQAIHIPEVIGYNENESLQFIVLEFIEGGSRSKDFWRILGNQLAALHQQTNSEFGLTYPNYMGSLHQFNSQSISWIDFFIEQRLQVQVKLAVDSRLVEISFVNKFETLYKKLPSLLSTEKPSLLHGDLWRGNLLVNSEGEPCLIDPAIYYGHREVDLGMTQLFDGFDEEFYNAYCEVFPLQPGYQQRFDLYNLYSLLVHVNLFGRSYLGQINAIIEKLL